MEKNTLVIEKMVPGGKCIATSSEGKKIFISGCLPGEKVEIQITNEKKDYCEAKTVQIIEKSPFRIEPKCPKFSTCGGCNLQFAEYDYQIELKKQILFDILKRNEINFPLENIVAVKSSPWNYRNRFQLHKGCLFERGCNFSSTKNSLIPFDSCQVAVSSINKYFSEKKNLSEASKYEKFFVFSSENGLDKNGLNKNASDSAKSSIFCASAIDDNLENKKSVIGKKNAKVKTGGKRKIYEGTLFNENSLACAKIDGKEIHFDVRGFFQSNLEMLEKTSQIIKEDFFGQNLLDIYAGCGTFSVILSDQFQNSTLVEHNRDAITFAQMNLHNTNLEKNHESFGLSGEKFAQLNLKKDFDAVVIDPPRSGIEKAVLDWLIKKDIPRFRSLSCDPVTHGRDLGTLTKNGYSIKKLYLLDYYPQTSHIESLAILEKE